MKKNIIKTFIVALAMMLSFNIVGCDTIREESKRLCLSASLPLPISLEYRYLEEPVTKEVRYQSDDAKRLANEELQKQLAEIRGLQILTSKQSWEEEPECYRLTFSMTCVENIAMRVPIQIN